MKPATFPAPFGHSLTLLSILFSLTLTIQAQDFGRYRPSVRWQQINTPAVRVIYPEGLERQARRVANTIGYVSRFHTASIGPASRQIDLVLDDEGIVSNGYVTLMPYHSVFYTTPPQDLFALGSLPWLDLLSLHEYRHALQYVNLNGGLSKVFWWLYGESGWAGIMFLTTPRWFFEGDAVATETALSNQGRGRIPAFFQPSRSILLNGHRYGYMKARNGSLKDIVPDEYELGYLLCSYGRENYGNDLWAETIKRTTNFRGILYPFSNSLASLTGMGTRRFYETALADYREKWSMEESRRAMTPYTELSPATRKVTQYYFPSVEPDGSVLVYKSSYDRAGAIYRATPDGGEKRVCRTGISTDAWFSAAGNRLAWTEVTWDPRYSARNYSDVVLYQIDTKTKTYLTHKQRYFSPALSVDGRRILVAEVEPAGGCRLKILDGRTGRTEITLPNPDSLFYTYPQWSSDGSSVVSTARTTAGKTVIVRQELESGRITRLTDEFTEVTGEVEVAPGVLYFAAGFDGITNIYSLTLGDGKIRQLTGSAFGAMYPAVDPDRKRLYYCDYTERGYRLVSVSLDSLSGQPLDQSVSRGSGLYEFDYFNREGGNILDNIPDTVYPTEPYRKFRHSIRVHSWYPQTDGYSIGAGIVSDNILDNLHIESGLRYYLNEKSPAGELIVRYGGLYPVLSARISGIYRHANLLDVIAGKEPASPLSFDRQLSLDISFPFNLTRGEFYRNAFLTAGYQFISSRNLSTDYTNYDPLTRFGALTAEAGFSGIRKKARQNINTPMGYRFDALASHSAGSTLAYRYQITGDFSFRGLFPNHNLILDAGWKSEPDEVSYHFTDRFLYPRGFLIPRNDWMATWQASYHFPIAYPDFGFLGVFYCTRIRADLFADGAVAGYPAGAYPGFDGRYFSAGAELIIDSRWFNLADIPFGWRVSWLKTPDPGKPKKKFAFEFVIPVMRL